MSNINRKKLNKKIKRKPIWLIYTLLTFAAIVLAITTQYFTVEAQIYTPGFGGMSSGIAYVLSDIIVGVDDADKWKTMSVMFYWVFYILFNIPVFYFMWKWYGRTFFIRTIYVFVVNFGTTMVLNYAIPLEHLIEEVTSGDNFEAISMIRTILLGGLGGALFGLAVGTALSNGGSTAGFDPITKYLSREKGKNISSILFIMGISVSFIFIFIRSFTTINSMNNYDLEYFIYHVVASPQMIATLVFLTVYSAVAKVLYSVTKKLEISVISKKIDKISKYFNDLNYHRSHTIINAIGGYSKEEFQMLQMIINVEELNDVIEDIINIDDNALVNVKEIKEIYDMHDWTPKTKYDKDLMKKRETSSLNKKQKNTKNNVSK